MVLTRSTVHGPHSRTVTGTDVPSGWKIWVMPTLRPSSPTRIVTLRLIVWVGDNSPAGSQTRGAPRDADGLRSPGFGVGFHRGSHPGRLAIPGDGAVSRRESIPAD